MTPDRDPFHSAAAEAEVELYYKDLRPDADAPDARPPYRLTARQLGIAFCIALAAGAGFAFWTRPLPPPPPDEPVTSQPATKPIAPAKLPAGRIVDATVGERVSQVQPGPPAFAMNLTDVQRAPEPPQSDPASQPTSRNVAAVAPARTPNSMATAGDETSDRDEAPSFDCRYARSASEQMVCEDPSLALADRVMDQSYQMALAAGVPGEMLRAEQADWRAARESAAHYSRDAVADVYDQRIAELRAMADEWTE